MVDPRRFARRLARTSAAAWLAGVSLIAGVALATGARAGQQELDAHLLVHAVAVYGMAWFDETGAFHEEVIRKEVDSLDPAVDLYVVTPDGVRWRGPKNQLDPEGLVALAARAMDVNGEVSLDGVDATGRPLRGLAMPTFDDLDQMVGAVIVMSDPTPTRAAWRQFAAGVILAAALAALAGIAVSAWLARRALTPLEEALRERERFLAAAAHELRTPMASLQAIAESTRAGDAPPDAAWEAAEGVVDRAGAMVRRLLTFSRLPEAGLETERLRLDLLVEALLEDDDPAEMEACVVEGDPRLLSIAVRNLLENARRHGGGVARVVVREGGVRVLDHGPGLASPALMAPFAKGEGSAGSGLGLALVARIVALHGGEMWLAEGIGFTLGVA